MARVKGSKKSTSKSADKPEVKAPAPAGVSATLVDLDGDVDEVQVGFPDHSPCAPFFLAYHPARWTVVNAADKSLVVPALIRIPLEAGVEQVTVSSGGKRSFRAAVAKAQERGRTVIPHREGPGGKSYVQAVQVEGGVHHCTVFETLHLRTDVITPRHEAFAAWVDDLFDREVLPAPKRWALDELRSRIADRYNDAAEKADRSPAASARAARLKRDLDAVDAFLDKIPGEELVAAEGTEVDLTDE